MQIHKILSLSTMTASLLVLAGCTAQTATDTVSDVNTTNANVNTEVVANTNEVVTNANTNVVDDSEEAEVDASDWQTYTNEEYGFSFRYPSDWQIAQDIFSEYKESYDNPRYQVTEKDIVFLTSLSDDEIEDSLYEYRNQEVGASSGIMESIGKGEMISIAVSNTLVNELVSQPGFTYTIGDNITLNQGTEATDAYLEKRWEGNADYHDIYIPFETDQTTNTAKPIKSIVLSMETNGGEYNQEILLKIAKTFTHNWFVN